MGEYETGGRFGNRDALYGGDGADQMVGGLDSDRLVGGRGVDIGDGSEGADTIWDGGAGTDSVIFNGAVDPDVVLISVEVLQQTALTISGSKRKDAIFGTS